MNRKISLSWLLSRKIAMAKLKCVRCSIKL